MNVGYVVLGFVVGALLAGGGSWLLLGAVGGALIGALYGRLAQAERRTEALETQLRDLQARREGGRRVPDAVAGPAATDAEDEHADEPIADEAGTDAAWPDEHHPPATDTRLRGYRPEPSAATPAGSPGAPPEPQPATPAAEAAPPRPASLEIGLLQSGLRRAGAWFTTGNVPVKVGVVLSFFGVSFLLKYAIDRELLSVPIEVRLLAVAAGAVVMLVLGWRLRARARVYALSLQGGAIGLLFLDVFAAFRIWQLLPAPLAFALLVVLAVATGALAVLQSSRTLIVLGASGGFLAPVLASTGSGSHVALFSYYLLLNATVLGVAWFRAWRALNLIGFVFTFVIGSLWGYRYYRPEFLGSTEPFLVLYFLFYNAIAILYALRQPPERLGLVDGTLVFGTPVIAFALQAGLLRGSEYGLAISAAAVALFYAAVAAALFRRHGRPPRAYLRVLTESYVALAVAFATLAIPLALDARWTSAAWALEGAALVWIGTRQKRHLATLAGTALIGLASLAFLQRGWRHHAGWPVLNANVLGGLLVALAALFASRRLEDFDRPPLTLLYRLLSWLLFGWGVLWWLGTGIAEIGDRLHASEGHAVLAFIATTVLTAAWLGRDDRWRKAGQLTILWLPALAVIALLYYEIPPHHFLFTAGWLAWPLAFAVEAGVLYRMDRRGWRFAAIWHAASVLLLTTVVSLEVEWQTAAAVAGGWSRAACSTVPGLVALLLLRLRQRPAWPVPAQPVAYRALGWLLVAGQAVYVAAISVDRPGDPGPLGYRPVLNPFDLAMLWALFVAAVSLAFAYRERAQIESSALAAWWLPYRVVLAGALLIATSAALVRGVHHVAGVPWSFDRLFDSEAVQTALSIYWGLLGFAGMLAGARRVLRPLWLAGAGCMALVVVKLFLVDLGNSGTVARIVSFIGVGVLLLIVGYFAPVPPRHPAGPARAGDSPEGGA